MFSGSLVLNWIFLVWYYGLSHLTSPFLSLFSQYKVPALAALPFTSFVLFWECFPDLPLFLNSSASRSVLQLNETILTCLYLGSQSDDSSFRRGVFLCLVSSLSVIKHKQNSHELLLGMILVKVCSTLLFSFHSNLRTYES